MWTTKGKVSLSMMCVNLRVDHIIQTRTAIKDGQNIIDQRDRHAIQRLAGNAGHVRREHYVR